MRTFLFKMNDLHRDLDSRGNKDLSNMRFMIDVDNDPKLNGYYLRLIKEK